MKNQLVMLSIACATVITSCGTEEGKETKDEKVKTCKTYNKVEVDCADMDNVKKLEELAFTFSYLDFTAGMGYAEIIAANESILEEMEPMIPSLTKVIEADPAMADEYFNGVIEEELVNMDNYKKALADLETLEVKATWEQDPLFADEMDIMVRFNNTSSHGIRLLRGFMTYLDAEGNVLVDGNVTIYPFHFEPKIEGELIPSGYEGACDMGLNLEKEKRDLISTITFKIIEITY